MREREHGDAPPSIAGSRPLGPAAHPLGTRAPDGGAEAGASHADAPSEHLPPPTAHIFSCESRDGESMPISSWFPADRGQSPDAVVKLSTGDRETAEFWPPSSPPAGSHRSPSASPNSIFPAAGTLERQPGLEREEPEQHRFAPTHLDLRR